MSILEQNLSQGKLGKSSKDVSPSQLVFILMAVVVTGVWGFNFVIIAVGLYGMPPLVLAGLRFILAAIPAVFFVPRPKTSLKLLVLYGLFLGVGQFGLLFSAMSIGAGAGLSSILLQAQAFFTAILAVFFLNEKFRINHAIGMIIAFSGVGLIGWTQAQANPGTVAMNLPAFFMLMGGAIMWAAANITAKKMGNVNALSLVVWSSLVPPIPLFALSFFIDGPGAIGVALTHLNWLSLTSVAYLAFISTLLGYGLWNYLIVKRGATAVAPFSLLVPVFGVSSAALVLGEHFELVHLLAALLILLGLSFHVFGGRFFPAKKAPEKPNERKN